MNRLLLGSLSLVLLMSLSASAMDKGFSWSYAPADEDRAGADLAAFQLSKYLEQCQVNRPEIVAEVKAKLKAGEHYRKRTRDQKNRGTLLTVYVDRDNILHIVTYRNETCPDCEGSGTRAKPFDNVTGRLAVRFRCLKCNGEGEVKDYVNERYFTLSSEDYENPEEARERFKQKAYAGAPQGAERYVEMLASNNPQDRLEACVWLDQNYVRTGMFFQDIMPMLRKARYHEANEKKRMLVWQFWAGKDLPGERKRGYYRIYADSRNGKVVRKGFYSGS